MVVACDLVAGGVGMLLFWYFHQMVFVCHSLPGLGFKMKKKRIFILKGGLCHGQRISFSCSYFAGSGESNTGHFGLVVADG